MREDFKILVQKPPGREYTALYFSLRTTCFGFSLFFGSFSSALERRKMLNIVWDSVARRSLKKSRALLK